MYGNHEFVVVGGLATYDARSTDSFRQVGICVGGFSRPTDLAQCPLSGQSGKQLLVPRLPLMPLSDRRGSWLESRRPLRRLPAFVGTVELVSF